MIAIGEHSLSWFGVEEVYDEPDITAMVATFSPLLYRVAYSVLRTPLDAEDVVQETFLRVLRHQRSLATIRDLRPWLVRIAWNLALDRKRRSQPDQIDDATTAQLNANTQPADQALADTRYLALVLEVMERLPQREREVLLLSAVEELTTSEIAAVIGKSESTVRSLIFRAREHLHQRLAQIERNQSKSLQKGGTA